MFNVEELISRWGKNLIKYDISMSQKIILCNLVNDLMKYDFKLVPDMRIFYEECDRSIILHMYKKRDVCYQFYVYDFEEVNACVFTDGFSDPNIGFKSLGKTSLNINYIDRFVKTERIRRCLI